MRIAIDGPSASGKSVLAKSIARRYNIIYVDTGALYRAIGLAVHRLGIAKEDNAAIIAALAGIDVALVHTPEGQSVRLDGECVNHAIRTPEMSMYASAVSAIPEVRTFLLSLQQDIIAANSVVMDGRDIGTVIMPNADVKIFLTADPEERARRRFLELTGNGMNVTLAEVTEDMRQRDHNDSTRSTAPAVAAHDAVTINNTGYECGETLAEAERIIAERMGTV
ncbi:MAG: (d)CMP kinase [Oscillospiraceae bacterium]|nr:(d)CMP kinase [Oscillospiraceae bacterium]